jgi:hypothetical protein
MRMQRLLHGHPYDNKIIKLYNQLNKKGNHK